MIIQVMSKSDASIKCYTLQTNKPNKQHNNNKYIILDMKIICRMPQYCLKLTYIVVDQY